MVEESTTNQVRPPTTPPPEVPKPQEKKSKISETFSGLRVSLVPKELLGQDGPDLKLRLLVAVMIIILETGVILSGYYFVNQKVEAKKAEKIKLEQQYEVVKLQAMTKEQDMNEAMLFSRQMNVAMKSLDNHVYLTELINFIESNTLGGIKYDRILMDTKSGLVSLDISAPKYRAMAQQFVHFANVDEIMQMRNTSVSGEVSSDGILNSVFSTVILKINPSVWVGHPVTKKASLK